MVKASKSISMEVTVGGTVLGVKDAHTKALPLRIGTWGERGGLGGGEKGGERGNEGEGGRRCIDETVC